MGLISYIKVLIGNFLAVDDLKNVNIMGTGHCGRFLTVQILKNALIVGLSQARH